MLNGQLQFTRIWIVTGRTDLRNGIRRAQLSGQAQIRKESFRKRDSFSVLWK